MLPSKGKINLDMIRKEIRTNNDKITLEDNDVRALVKKESHERVKFSDFYGKENETYFLLEFSVARGNNSGGFFDFADYFFRGSHDVVLTECECVEGSHYERHGYIRFGPDKKRPTEWLFNQSEKRKKLKKPLTIDDNVILYIPGSADYWRGSFYGKIYNRNSSAKDFSTIPKKWHNLQEQK